MSEFYLSPLAQNDFFEIIDYIADKNVDAARRMRDRLFAAFTLLARRPSIGHLRNDLIPVAAGVRFWPVAQYLVIYRPVEPAIQIVRVLSGYRDVVSILSRPPA